VAIDTLPDDALLYIFDFYVAEAPGVEAWHTLVHICQRWRNIVSASLRRLNLRIACTNKTCVREKLEVWPALPIVVSGVCDSQECLDNIRAVLEHGDRIMSINLVVTWHLEEVFAALEAPFPALTDLELRSTDDWDDSPQIPLDPLKFLGGSTHLRSLTFAEIAIPRLPELLFFFSDLVVLRLVEIPYQGYFSPDAMATALSALTNLETFFFRFTSGESRLDWHNQESQHPASRSVLPSLHTFEFEGVCDYLEDLIPHIDVPAVELLSIDFFPRLIFNTPQLLHSLSHMPCTQALDEARVKFEGDVVWLEFSSGDFKAFRFGISSNEPERDFPTLTRFFHPPFNPLPRLEYLCISGDPYPQEYQRDDVENDRWLILFQPFTAVKDLKLSKEHLPFIAPALQELVGERATEVLPSLQNLFLDELLPAGPIHEAIMQFVAARQLSGHPLDICYRNDDD
jgi:hypothetical protein